MLRPANLFILLFLGLAACVEGLPDPRDLEYDRTLALQVEVVEEEDDTDGNEVDPGLAAPNQVLPGQTVRLRALSAGPDGAVSSEQFESQWYVCARNVAVPPVECVRQGLGASVEDCSTVAEAGGLGDALMCRLDEAGDQVQWTVPWLDDFAQGDTMTLVRVVSFDDDTSLNDCGDAIAAANSTFPEECGFAVHELPLGPPVALAELIEQGGGEVPPQLAAWPDDEVARNPAIEAVELRRVDEEGEELERWELAADEIVSVPAGAELEIEVELDPDAEQRFHIPVGQGTDFDEGEEALIGSWHTNLGELEVTRSRGTSMTQTWTLPDAEDLEREDGALWVVVRDGRHGTVWWRVQIAVEDG